MKQKLYYVSVWYNYSEGQVNFLYDLCDNDYWKLLALFHRLKHHYLFYCPASKDSVEKVLQLPPFKNRS